MSYKSFGLLQESELHPRDWRAGGVSGASRIVLKESGNYTDYLPQKEYQGGVYFDSMGCVSWSALNCLETIMNVKGVSWNKSDRFTAKMSGTTRQGNYLTSVANSLRHDGVVDEDVWPFPNKQRTPIFEWEDFYKEIPESVKMAGRLWASEWEVNYEWVPMSLIREQLAYGPIQVTVKAWPKPQANGLFTDGGDLNRNHAVMLFNATDEYYEIFDHYENVIKRLVPTYDFRTAMQYSLKKKHLTPMPPMDLPNDVLVQEVEQSGSFGIHLNGQIIVDDLSKLLATWLIRNNGSVAGKTVPLKKEIWDAFKKVNLKMQPL